MRYLTGILALSLTACYPYGLNDKAEWIARKTGITVEFSGQTVEEYPCMNDQLAHWVNDYLGMSKKERKLWVANTAARYEKLVLHPSVVSKVTKGDYTILSYVVSTQYGWNTVASKRLIDQSETTGADPITQLAVTPGAGGLLELTAQIERDESVRSVYYTSRVAVYDVVEAFDSPEFVTNAQAGRIWASTESWTPKVECGQLIPLTAIP